jgi:hypothetical protein
MYMLNNLKELLENTHLQEKIKSAADQSTVIDLLLTAGAEKGYAFTAEKIFQLLGELNDTLNELSEDNLLIISGGLAPATIGRCIPTHGGCTYTRYCI